LDPGLVASAGRIVESLSLLGPANIQCFQSAESGTQFIEINPRFSGGLALTIEAGVNTPAMALQLAAAIPVAPIRAYRLLKMCRYWDEVYYPATP
jgi:carbamoyl-phosphate synthase large subunit